MKLSDLILPLLLALFGLCAAFHKKDLIVPFVEGAKSGIQNAFSLLPTLTLLLTAVAMFRASGATELLSQLLSPLLTRVGVPSELTPLLIVRPLSGSGATALLSELYETYGPDSFVGRCATVLSASSDTVVYVGSVYMAAANIKKTRHTYPAAILVMLLGIVLSCLLVRLLL